MKFKEKIKNKLNTIKTEIKRQNCLNYETWLSSNGLEDNVENRGIYASHKLQIDDSNKKADMRLSQIIGRGVFLAIFIAVFIMLCVNSVGATFVVGNNTQNIDSMQGSITSAVITVPYNDGNNPYNIYYQYFYTPNHSNDFYCFYVDNVDSFIADVMVFENENPDTFNDIGILNYLVDKYPSVDFSPLYFIRFGGTTYFVSLYANSFMHINDYIDIGYADGYYIGFTEGSEDGYNRGLEEGSEDGYNRGYTDGVSEGEIAKKSIFAIFDAPIKLLTSLLDFEIFGINLLSIFKVILTILILGAIAKFALSIAL